VYALSTSAADAPAHDPIQVTMITAGNTESTARIVAQLRRDAMMVKVADPGVLELPPADPIFIVCLELSVAKALADRIVGWAATHELRAGLVGIVENGTVADHEALLAAGFDDVVSSPFSMRELVARIRALHRRVFAKSRPNGRLRFGELTLDLFGRDLWVDGKTISLTSIELAVVRELIKARGRPLSRAELLDLVWGDEELEISPRAVDNVILRIRRKLPRPELIETVRSVGFRIAGDR
jgi:DNA-binding response OmpR family regulator